MAYHVPIMVDQVIEYLNIDPNGIYIDCTVGGGGHSYEIAKRLKSGQLYCFDQDREALQEASVRLKEFSDKVEFLHSNFVNYKDIIEEKNIQDIKGVLLDIGVSSHQLDEAGRGFSYMQEGDLDMRMDKSQGLSARDIINTYKEEELTRIFRTYGEERFSKLIARKIIEKRQTSAIQTTFDLVELIRSAIPNKFLRTAKGHPAKKVFQALRIEVNNELKVLEDSLEDMIMSLSPGGRIVVISFHSLEDRIVKNTFRELERDCVCPSEIPICVCDKTQEIKTLTRRPIQASDQEIQRNSRAKPAKLRAAERLGRS